MMHIKYFCFAILMFPQITFAGGLNGVWDGTLAHQNIELCISDKDSGYFYDRYRKIITLNRGETSRDFIEMGPHGEKYLWRLDLIGGDDLKGRWINVGKSQDLPVRLARVNANSVYGDSCIETLKSAILNSSKNIDRETIKLNGKSYRLLDSDPDGYKERHRIGLTRYHAAYIAKDYDMAQSLAKQAAERGDADAQFFLASTEYDEGGRHPDCKLAIQWYLESALQGYAQAQINLGIIFQGGLCVKEDISESIDILKKAASNAGDEQVSAQRELGFIYGQDGVGVKHDSAQAAKWFSIAAQRGDTLSQDRLAEMYEYGRGVKKDYVLAVKLYRKSATNGNNHSLAALANMYENGRGVDRSFEDAYFLYNLLDKYKSDDDTTTENNLNRIKSKLSERQKKQVDKEIEKWEFGSPFPF